jgi:F-type H+-transporting ATPase subunit alpha
MRVEDIRRFESELYHYLDNSKPEILAAIRDKKELTDDIKAQLKAAIDEAKVRFGKAPAKA